MQRSLIKLRLRTKRVVRITISWMVVGVIAALFRWKLLQDQGMATPLSELVNDGIWTAFVAGVLGGGVYIFILRDHLRKHPFLPAFLIMTVLVSTVVIAVHGFRTGPAGTYEQLTDMCSWIDALYWSLLMGATMFMVRINDQYGSGGLMHLLGRYHRPRPELRIFMFLDMRSSTTIAEELGHVKYFQLLNDVYAQITDPVIYSGGEIYQFIGDEISVTWKFRKGIRYLSCIRCFFEIERKISERRSFYLSKYGIAPEFKAGMHFGQVTTGEVGLVKKELIFTGDVVNTAARIQNKCNEHGVDILISRALLDALNIPDGLFDSRHIGQISLKGKKNEVDVWTIAPIEESD